MRFKIFHFKNVESTNQTAAKLIKDKKAEKGFVYSDNQTNGKGTYGKKWISLKGNLFGSIFFPLKYNYPTFNEFSIINAIIISEAIKQFCSNQDINLKFPNDIMLNKKKVYGILQETFDFKKKKFLIIGIGINTFDNPEINSKYKATSIFKETKNTPNIKEMISKISLYYEKFFINLSSYDYLYFKKKADLMALN